MFKTIFDNFKQSVIIVSKKKYIKTKYVNNVFISTWNSQLCEFLSNTDMSSINSQQPGSRSFCSNERMKEVFDSIRLKCASFCWPQNNTETTVDDEEMPLYQTFLNKGILKVYMDDTTLMSSSEGLSSNGRQNSRAYSLTDLFNMKQEVLQNLKFQTIAPSSK